MRYLFYALCIVGGLFLGYQAAQAHTEYCDGIRILDIRGFGADQVLKVTELIHFASADLHMETQPRWVSIKMYKEWGCEL